MKYLLFLLFVTDPFMLGEKSIFWNCELYTAQENRSLIVYQKS